MAAVSFPPAIPTLSLAGRVFTDFQNFKVLRGYCSGTTNVRCTPRELSGSAGYQVPVGKKFKVKAARVLTQNSTAGNTSIFTLGYADNDVGQNASTAFTNQVYPTNGVEAAACGSIGLNTTCTHEFLFFDWEIPAGKYIAMTALGTTVIALNIEIFGEEVDA